MKNKVFSPQKIGNVEIKNRFLFAATHDNLDNNPQLRQKHYVDLIKGGVGLIISGATSFNDPKSWQDVITAIHDVDGKIFSQIIPIRMSNVYCSEISADSQFFHPFLMPYQPNRPYTKTEIIATINQYADFAAKAQELGADGVEIHAAHHSVAAWFLSPAINQRQDEWGGSPTKRLNFHKQIYDAIRKKTGPDFPLIIKLGVCDMIDNGLSVEDGIDAAKILLDYGYDALEVSQGIMNLNLPQYQGTPMRQFISKESQEGYFSSWSQRIKTLSDKPIIVTGGFFSLSVINNVIESGASDMISICRAFIRESDLVNKWANERVEKASCISCNKCITELLAKKLPLECYIDKAGTEI